MPSRRSPTLSPASPPPGLLQHHQKTHISILSLALLISLSLTFLTFTIVTIVFIYRKLFLNRTTPADHPHHPCRRFSFSLIRRATAAFSPSTRLGHGGFGSVHKANLSHQSVAVKLMDSVGSLQGEREFHNELSISSSLHHPNVVSLLGYSSNGRKTKLLLVYELMENRSLQDALLDRKCEELMIWERRFCIAVDVAKGLEYLHHDCDPPVIHGDIKPSNVLLDSDFRAKIGDFGLARVKTEDLVDGEKRDGGEDNGSILEETESVVTGYEENSLAIDESPESCVIKVLDAETSPDLVSESFLEKDCSIDSGKGLILEKKKEGSRRDWWWKQENVGCESGRVKDYVMEWIGSEIKKERPKTEWIASTRAESSDCEQKRKKQKKKLEWWASLDEERWRRKEKNRKPREWWKEEFCDELAKKNKKKKRELNPSESWWQKDDDFVHERKKRKSKSSRSSIDWWLDGLSGDLRSFRRNSQDWASGDIPKSGGVSSTPSMRGTVCYIAPEYGGGGNLTEKCDVYSFGVLLLVLMSGRRPLQVMASPMSEFERANLISWAKQLARNGRLLELVDPSVYSLDNDQALRCLTTALLCLQKSPSKRPSMKEIIGMLSGEAEPPCLPFEFSPSPPTNFPFKSRDKAW